MRQRRKKIVFWITYRSKLSLIAYALLLGLLIVVLSIDVPTTKTWEPFSLPLSGKVIAIDAGHGGIDGGAVSREGAIEKDINLAVSFYLRDYLQQAGALVVMTREVDKDLADPDARYRKAQDLLRRVELIRDKQADLLISIHMNSMPSSRWSGAQTFYYPKQHEGNRLLATLIQDEIIENLHNTVRQPKAIRTLYLLKSVEIPAALVEVGFLSNPEEARRLVDENYQKKISAAIYRGILRYTSGEILGSTE